MGGSCRATPRTKAVRSLQPNRQRQPERRLRRWADHADECDALDLPDYALRLPNGLEATNVSTQTWFGVSPDNSGFLLMPALICDPSKGLKSGQRFNPKCFGMPAYGQQGPLNWPYMRGPAYFDSDLALFKNFQITERQKLQFRISAVNWLNHPLATIRTWRATPTKRYPFTGHRRRSSSAALEPVQCGQRVRLCPREHRRYYLYRVAGA